LLDNRVTESWSKIPGLGDIPFFGKLFRSRLLNKANAELMVLVSPEIVRPIPAGQPGPEIEMPHEFMKGVSQTVPRTPGIDKTGAAKAAPVQDSMPVEQLIDSMKGAPKQAPVQVMPMIYPMPVPAETAPKPTTEATPGNTR
jgi:pilus assembly protein CpaC